MQHFTRQEYEHESFSHRWKVTDDDTVQVQLLLTEVSHLLVLPRHHWLLVHGIGILSAIGPSFVLGLPPAVVVVAGSLRMPHAPLHPPYSMPYLWPTSSHSCWAGAKG
jgi:hypothetical protein